MCADTHGYVFTHDVLSYIFESAKLCKSHLSTVLLHSYSHSNVPTHPEYICIVVINSHPTTHSKSKDKMILSAIRICGG